MEETLQTDIEVGDFNCNRGVMLQISFSKQFGYVISIIQQARHAFLDIGPTSFSRYRFSQYLLSFTAIDICRFGLTLTAVAICCTYYTIAYLPVALLVPIGLLTFRSDW